MAEKRLCSIQNCSKPALKRGMCNPHYLRWWRHGDPNHGRTMVGDPEQFMLDAILSSAEECILWPFARDHYGRAQINLPCEDSKYTAKIVCRRVHGDPPTPDHEAAHSCGNGHLGCINPNHLSWKTHLENGADMVEHGRSHRGDHPMAKLTTDDVLAIRELHGKLSALELSRRFGVGRDYIYSIQNYRRWQWLP